MNRPQPSSYASFALRALTLVTILLTSACASLSQDSETEPQRYDWSSIEPRLHNLASWRLIGKIGIRTPSESVTAAINQWTQVDDFFDINLSSTFFGLGATRINGNAHLITLHEGGEDPVQSNQPDLLVEEALGIPLPLTHLPYWIRALPIPEAPYQISFNNEGLPATISQFGWELEFSKYQEVDTLPLPGKIKLRSARSSITLAIKEWTPI